MKFWSNGSDLAKELVDMIKVRNTVLTIQTIRELKEYGVEVCFDNENLSTFDAKNESMFSFISSMAQEESRHISENVMWTVQKEMNEVKLWEKTYMMKWEKEFYT